MSSRPWSIPGLDAFMTHRQITRILARSRTLEAWPNERLEALAQTLRRKILQERNHAVHWNERILRWIGHPSPVLSELFALIRVISQRELGMAHHPVQLAGGLAMANGRLAEMQTGEGKTLTATLAAGFHGLDGRGCHVITVNDYLAKRDAEKMSPIYRRLGLTVGIVVAESSPDERRQAYRCDVTYTTGREVGFDFLRDRLTWGAVAQEPARVFNPTHREGPVQRPLHFALIDEADSVLIDDAGTPLIIALPEEADDHQKELMSWSRETALALKSDLDFQWQNERRDAHLTEAGCRKILLRAWPEALRSSTHDEVYHAVEQALRAERYFLRDRDYLVDDKSEVSIIDEGTGRLLEGRRWQGGLHQAIEWKEQVELSAEMGEGARVTVQGYFRRYRVLAGMTGTASSARREFVKHYRLPVMVIPTHQPCRRQVLPPRIFGTREQRLAALAANVRDLVAAGRSVLIGTTSVEASHELAKGLLREKMTVTVLNATRHAEEARIITDAGQPGRVTIATNMAGRGTDIHLHEDVRAAGGLHVIATEMHTSQRIDRQLFGRAARQGDPGSCQFLLSLDGDLAQQFPKSRRVRLERLAQRSPHGELPASTFRLFRNFQKGLERKATRSRSQLVRQGQAQEKTARMLGLDVCLEFVD